MLSLVEMWPVANLLVLQFLPETVVVYAISGIARQEHAVSRVHTGLG